MDIATVSVLLCAVVLVAALCHALWARRAKAKREVVRLHDSFLLAAQKDAAGAVPAVYGAIVAESSAKTSVKRRKEASGLKARMLAAAFAALAASLAAMPDETASAFTGRANPFVLLIGDSMMGVLGRVMEKALMETNAVSAVTCTSFGTGLTRPGIFDWGMKIDALTATARPEMAVVFFGADDRQLVEAAEGVVAYDRANDWRAAYAEHVGRTMDRLEARDVRRIVWLLLPDMRELPWQEHARLVNEIVADEAATRTNTVSLFDLGPILSRRPGTYTRYVMTGDGSALTVRDADGIHLSVDGARLVASALIKAFVHTPRAP